MLHDQSDAVERPVDFLVRHQAVDRDVQSALRLGRWKIVKTWASRLLELFDISKDVGETRNLVEAQPERADRMHAILTEYLAMVGAATRRTDD